MINFDVEFSGEFKAPDEATLRRAISLGLKEAGEQIQNQARNNMGARPGPFVQTGKLRASIHNEVSSDGLSVVVGTNVVYARRVEMGHSGTETVRAHKRRQSIAFGTPIKGGPVEVDVQAFQRTVNAKPYPYLRPAVDYAMRIKMVEDLINSNIVFELQSK